MMLQSFHMDTLSIQNRGKAEGFSLWTVYKPYCNTLTLFEQEKLMEMYTKAEGGDKEILKRVLRKYGADKLEL